MMFDARRGPFAPSSLVALSCFGQVDGLTAGTPRPTPSHKRHREGRLEPSDSVPSRAGGMIRRCRPASRSRSDALAAYAPHATDNGTWLTTCRLDVEPRPPCKCFVSLPTIARRRSVRASCSVHLPPTSDPVDPSRVGPRQGEELGALAVRSEANEGPDEVRPADIWPHELAEVGSEARQY